MGLVTLIIKTRPLYDGTNARPEFSLIHDLIKSLKANAVWWLMMSTALSAIMGFVTFAPLRQPAMAYTCSYMLLQYHIQN
eukprot:scaffold167719_cov19-Prasinocladus_malaysianus.AAC.1